MKYFLRIVLLLVLVAAVTFARKDPLAEKHAEGRKAVQSSPATAVLLRTAAVTWDTLSFQSNIEEYDDIITLPGGVIWVGGFVEGTDEDFVLRSVDNGATWQRHSLISFTNAAGFALAARDSNIALAATWIGDIYRTTNGGADWTLVFNYGGGNGFFDGIEFTGGDSVMALGDADASGLCVVKSTDAGATWTRFTNLPTVEATTTNLAASATYHQAMDAIGPHVWMTSYVGSGTAPRILRTTDFGTTWTSVAVPLTGGLTQAYTIRSINMADTSVGWLVPRQTAASTRYFVHKTTDGGMTWSDTILVERGAVVAAVKPVPGTNNVVLGLGYRGNNPKAWWSTDGGGTWTDVSPAAKEDGSDLRNASFVSPTLAYVTGLYAAMKFVPEGATGVEQQPTDLPQSYALGQNYPNPFNPSTTIQYSITRSDMVSLKVFSVLGEEVVTLVNQAQAPGSYTVTFNAANLPSGVYFYRLQSGRFSEVRKMAILK